MESDQYLQISGVENNHRLESRILEERIQKAVAEQFDVRLADMTSKRRPQSVAVPRQVAMYLCRRCTRASLPEIAADPEVLWVNVPYPVVRLLAPRSVRSLVRRARRKGVHHTLRYRHDRSWRRLLELARLDVRVALGYARHLRTRPGR